jgi:predicted enzyme involved in methoxymalonyl-ACP biosynthesis
MDSIKGEVYIGKRKDWVRKFVDQGLSFEQACIEAYLKEDDIEIIRDDQDFMDGIMSTTIKNKIRFLTDYNDKVSKSKNPQDAIKQLQVTFPNTFEPKQVANDVPTLPIMIHFGNGSIREIEAE